jgi:hypothetical protein
MFRRRKKEPAAAEAAGEKIISPTPLSRARMDLANGTGHRSTGDGLSAAAASAADPLPPRQQPKAKAAGGRMIGGSPPLRRRGAAQTTKRSSSLPPSLRMRGRTRIEEHFRVDPDHRSVLPGVIKYEDDIARDLHDFSNLIALVPVIVLNSMNWNWDKLGRAVSLFGGEGGDLSDAWTGEWFDLFFRVSALYFVADLIWVSVQPSCVKSPGTILVHHIATLLYIILPYIYPEVRWIMGACMSVEVNTWFLIARRVFNKQGLPPWTIDLPFAVSFRVKLISVSFYATWILTRNLLYPVIWVLMLRMFLEHSAESDHINVMAIALPFHTIFCFLNFKWSWDLLMSKLRYWRKGGGGSIQSGL